MKTIICFFVFITGMASCKDHSEIQRLSSRLDSLKRQLDNTYKPGFGEFMSGIQVHHAKLWFAGINNNWELADFEVHEIMENIAAVKKYETDREESKSIPMIEPALDSVSEAIRHKDLARFKNRFMILTNTCNKCHQAVHFSFNEVKIPDAPPYSNQVFAKKEK